VLGGITFDPSTRQRPLVTALDSHAPRVEAFRVLRTNLQFVDVDSNAKVFVVTSALPEEGKTSTSVNLAITLAQAGHRTVLIEGDLRRPKAAAALQLDNAVGVTTVLLGRVTLEDAIQRHPESDLDVLASGAIPPNPAELLQSNAMSDLVKQLRDNYDMVVIDAPPLLPVTDAALLATHADGALLVVRYAKTTRDQLAQAVDRLAQVDAAPVGVVLNMVPNKRRAYGYGYGYGYGYAPTNPAPGRRSSRRRFRKRKR
jgi:receptor protein-tyrosine kinase